MFTGAVVVAWYIVAGDPDVPCSAIADNENDVICAESLPYLKNPEKSSLIDYR